MLLSILIFQTHTYPNMFSILREWQRTSPPPVALCISCNKPLPSLHSTLCTISSTPIVTVAVKGVGDHPPPNICRNPPLLHPMELRAFISNSLQVCEDCSSSGFEFRKWTTVDNVLASVRRQNTHLDLTNYLSLRDDHTPISRS